MRYLILLLFAARAFAATISQTHANFTNPATDYPVPYEYQDVFTPFDTSLGTLQKTTLTITATTHGDAVRVTAYNWAGPNAATPPNLVFTVPAGGSATGSYVLSPVPVHGSYYFKIGYAGTAGTIANSITTLTYEYKPRHGHHGHGHGKP